MVKNVIHPSVIAIRTTVMGIILSLILVIVKWLAGHFGHSYALIADATESAADIISSGLLWFALRISLKEPDGEHPYGHGKAEPIAAIAVALFLVGTALWIAFHAVELINSPHQTPKIFTLWVLAGVIAAKEFMFRYVMSVGKKIDSEAVKADAYHHRSDAITSISAFIGISIALIGGRGYESADDWAALAASVLIFYNAVKIMRPALDEIMDTAPSHDVVQKIANIASSVKEVRRVEKCYVRKMGFDYYVDIHIEVDADLTVSEGHRIAHLVKNAILGSGSRVMNVMVHVEPYSGV
jgi:cation diffusion facilitator family transporter